MTSLRFATILLIAGLGLPDAAQGQDGASLEPRLVFEGADRPHVERTPEMLEMRAGPGRLRIPHLLRGFDLRVHFRLAQADTAAALTIATWPEAGGAGAHYSVDLGSVVKGTPSVENDGVPLPSLSTGMPGPGTTDGWMRLDVRREGHELSLALNGAVVAVYRLDRWPAVIAFRTTRGTLHVKRIALSRTIAAGSEQQTLWDALPHGNRAGDVQLPRVERDLKPSYTAEAMRRGAEGVVEVEAIVLPDGTVGDVRLVRALDPDLDAQAIAAVNRWTFKPARRGSVNVPMVVSIELRFVLKGTP